jgi:hypothetical protein
MSKEQFVRSAPELTANINGHALVAQPREFSTGSVGYLINGKITLPDGTRLQVSGNAVAIGSKNWEN